MSNVTVTNKAVALHGGVLVATRLTTLKGFAPNLVADYCYDLKIFGHDGTIIKFCELLEEDRGSIAVALSEVVQWLTSV